ncbi:MAG: Uma2 family endonuclease [Candidatus Magnetoovum sp. WYHC-5]|nr:Uma2 family endonuclease [Candidatus Magnetoovum sp. WYHC-5]
MNIQVAESPPVLLEQDFDLTEIINGEEIMSPSPFGSHQRIIMRLIEKLVLFLNTHPIGELCVSPFDVILEENANRVQPDLFFVKKENRSIFQEWVQGVPDMVCEIVSKGSHSKDTITKKMIYEHYKVPEYWIVIPELEAIEVLVIEDDRYRLFSCAEGEGIVKSKTIEGFEVDIKDVFVK